MLDEQIILDHNIIVYFKIFNHTIYQKNLEKLICLGIEKEG